MVERHGKSEHAVNTEELIEKVVRLRIFYDRNLHTDSMRGNVIILSSVIHALLSDLIKDDASIRRGKSPYTTFAEAINSALLLGIIRDSTSKGLHLLRELRNELAHGVDLLGNDLEVSQRVNAISEALAVVPYDEPDDEPKWVLHGVAIKLIHGICYDYAASLGSSRDAVLAQWEPIRQRVLKSAT